MLQPLEALKGRVTDPRLDPPPQQFKEGRNFGQMLRKCRLSSLFPRSNRVTHVVSESSQASALWAWLKERAPEDLPSMHVVNITWFTDSMRESRPVAVETRHLIQVGGTRTRWFNISDVSSPDQRLLEDLNSSPGDLDSWSIFIFTLS